MISAILGGPKFTLGGPAPTWTPPPKASTLPHLSVFLISAPLTCHFAHLRRALSIIGFALKGPPKWGFGSNFGVRAKIFGGNPLGMQRPPIYAFSDIFGPDLMRHVVAFCVGIAICHRRKFGQVWGPQLHYQTFDYHM